MCRIHPTLSIDKDLVRIGFRVLLMNRNIIDLLLNLENSIFNRIFLVHLHALLFTLQSYEDFLKKYENETEELGCRSPSTESNDSKVFEID